MADRIVSALIRAKAIKMSKCDPMEIRINNRNAKRMFQGGVSPLTWKNLPPSGYSAVYGCGMLLVTDDIIALRADEATLAARLHSMRFGGWLCPSSAC